MALPMTRIERVGWGELVEAAYRRGTPPAPPEQLLRELAPDDVLTATDRAVVDYVNDPGLCSENEGEFPSRAALTGLYYVKRLADFGVMNNRYRLLVSCACLGTLLGNEADYLGLDVRLSLSASRGELSVDAVDSFVM